jgi:hypothetical protein
VPIVGGIAAPKQERLLSYSPPILVATPGRLWQLVQEHPYLSDLSSVKFLVVDEADRCAIFLDQIVLGGAPKSSYISFFVSLQDWSWLYQ